MPNMNMNSNAAPTIFVCDKLNTFVDSGGAAASKLAHGTLSHMLDCDASILLASQMTFSSADRRFISFNIHSTKYHRSTSSGIASIFEGTSSSKYFSFSRDCKNSNSLLILDSNLVQNAFLPVGRHSENKKQ